MQNNVKSLLLKTINMNLVIWSFIYTLSGETFSGEIIRQAKFLSLNEKFVTFALRKISTREASHLDKF